MNQAAFQTDIRAHALYPSGVARGQPDLARFSRHYCRIVFEDFDQIDQVFDAEVGEHHLALVVDPMSYGGIWVMTA